MKKQTKWNNWLLIFGVIILAVTPVIFIKGAEFGGADGQAETAIKEIEPKYEPWLNSLIELPSKEVESLMFAVQAAAGAGVIGYVIGLYKGRSQQRKHHETD
jgi:cobalt/nickel transport protein